MLNKILHELHANKPFIASYHNRNNPVQKYSDFINPWPQGIRRNCFVNTHCDVTERRVVT